MSTVQNVIFLSIVYRVKGKDKEDPISYGTATCEVGDILGSKNQTKVKRLPSGGVVFCRLETVKTSNSNLIARFQFQAFFNNSRKSLLSKRSIFEISRKHPNAHRNSWLVVYRSSPVSESLEPRWDAAELDLEALCNGDFDRPLRLRVSVDESKRGGNFCIGQCETTLRMILNTQSVESSIKGFRIFKSIGSQVVVGRLDVKLAQVVDLKLEQEVMMDSFQMNGDEDVFSPGFSRSPTTVSSFSNYIDSGWLLDFMIAIDFTSSNGDPRIPGTLHYQATDSFNDYEECIQSIGGVLGLYSQSCIIWGFGAKFDSITRHLFQLGSTTTYHGSVDGVLEAYRSIFQSDLIMSGPTLFDQVIQAAAVRANKSKIDSALRYSVLLILTDGMSEDFGETRRKLDVYRFLPLSVLFVGLGRSDFSTLRQLTSEDDENRGISSLVEYREHQHDPKSLGTAAFGIVSRQFLEYMISNHIQT